MVQMILAGTPNENSNFLAMFPEYQAYVTANQENKPSHVMYDLAVYARVEAGIEDSRLEQLRRRGNQALMDTPFSLAPEFSTLVMRTEDEDRVDVFLVDEDGLLAGTYPLALLEDVEKAVQALAMRHMLFSESSVDAPVPHGSRHTPGYRVHLVANEMANHLSYADYEDLYDFVVAHISSADAHSSVMKVARRLRHAGPTEPLSEAEYELQFSIRARIDVYDRF